MEIISGEWYDSTTADSNGVNASTYGLTTDIELDYSAINYYVEAYAFTNWVVDKLEDISPTKLVGGESTPTTEKPLNIGSANNPEDNNSAFAQRKRAVMKDSINSYLNLSISNYNRRVADNYEGFYLPALTETDWDQVFSNISIITFFQGVPIGLKHYNNYAIATSTINREYVDKSKIYFCGGDSYHIRNCSELSEEDIVGYRSVEYELRKHSYREGDETLVKYWYPHGNISEKACYYCLVNKSNYTEIEDKTKYNKAYNEALARERYVNR